MATFNKFNQFVRDVLEAKHNFASDMFYVALSNAQPQPEDTVLADITQIAPGNGYVDGGIPVPVMTALTADRARVEGTEAVFTATGGLIGPVRYAVMYNDDKPGKPLVGWWDYGESVVLQLTEQFTVRFIDTGEILSLR